MFEKEAEEYKKEHIHYDEGRERHYYDVTVQQAFKDGAEFSYNLAKEKMDYLNQHWWNGKDKTNEWYYCKDELPEIKVGNCIDVEVCFLNAFDNPCKKSCYWNGKDFLYWSDKKPIGEKKVSLFGKIYAWKYADNFFPEPPKESK